MLATVLSVPANMNAIEKIYDEGCGCSRNDATQLTVGICDNFTLPTEPTYPSQALWNWIDVNYQGTNVTRQCDETGDDIYWANTFNLTGVCSQGYIKGATLSITVKNMDYGFDNDNMLLGCIEDNADNWDIARNLTINCGIPLGQSKTIVMDLAADYPQVFNNMINHSFLDVGVQDDSYVDCAILTIYCYNCVQIGSSANNTVLCCGNQAYEVNPSPWGASKASILEKNCSAHWLSDKSDGRIDFQYECNCFCTTFNLRCAVVDYAYIKYGGDDSISIWLNGHLISTPHTPEWRDLFIDKVQASYFISGENHLIVMVCDVNGSYTGGIWCLEICCKTSPPDSPVIDGPNVGKVGTEYTWTFNSADLEGDDVYYYIEWGDGTNTGWVGPYPCSTSVEEHHTYTKLGTYIIKAKAKDITDLESGWSEQIVVMPKNKPLTNTQLLQFFNNFLHSHTNLLQILQKINQRLGLQ